MENLPDLLADLIKKLRKEILEYYKRCYLYIKDLYSYKKININTKLSDISDELIEKNIYAMISATNSALNTIGIRFEELTQDKELFNNIFKDFDESYLDYNSFFNTQFKPYINKHLFRIILEYIIGIDEKKIQNLDLFDLLPKKFINKLNQFKKQETLDLEQKRYFQQILRRIDEFYDVNEFLINIDKFNTLFNKIKADSSEDILHLLEEAKKENIQVLGKSFILKESLSSNIQVEIDERFSFLDYFGNFPKLNDEIINKLNININNLVETEIKFLDLETLFYYIAILRIIGKDFPFASDEILRLLKNFISGKVFSTGMYHKPNPISILFGLSILAELNLINQTEIIDTLDIEMFLENELKNFLPEKLSLNFYSLLSLRILEKNGGVISNKDHLIKPLIDLDLLRLEDKNLPMDLLYHLGLLKLIDRNINFNIFKNVYNSEIKKLITPKGLINNNLTDTSRALLIYDLLDLKNEEATTVSILYRNLISYSNFFSDENLEEDFNWKNNKLALKVELRMLFWTILASLQYLDLQV
ncbi:MAG: hypothetical protein ACFFGP_08320 [Promethearchaeota archaeon]